MKDEKKSKIIFIFLTINQTALLVTCNLCPESGQTQIYKFSVIWGTGNQRTPKYKQASYSLPIKYAHKIS